MEVITSRQSTAVGMATYNYDLKYEYNAAGVLTKEKYPSTIVVGTEIDSAGRVAG